LHFYTDLSVNRRLIQDDYIVILEGIVALNWDNEMILLEDNDGPHGTRGKGDNKVKKAKLRLDIKWEANPPESPDLNPIETIWRLVKQRLKNRGLIRDAIELR
jgi:transposase